MVRLFFFVVVESLATHERITDARFLFLLFFLSFLFSSSSPPLLLSRQSHPLPALHRLGIDMTDLDFFQLMRKVDADQSGSVDVQELKEAVMNENQVPSSKQEEKVERPERLVWRKVFHFLKKKGVKTTT